MQQTKIFKVLYNYYMNKAKDIIFYIVIGTGLYYLNYSLNSVFLPHFLQEQLISLLGTLLAINIANSTLLLSKLEDVLTKQGITKNSTTFAKTRKEVRNNLKEQIILICIALLALVVWESPLFAKSSVGHITGAICSSTLIYALAILWDIAKAVFIILDFSQK